MAIGGAAGSGLTMVNLASAGSRLTGLLDAVPATAETNMAVACLELEAEIKRRSPVDTGHLRASYTHEVHRSGDVVTGLVGTNVDYAAPQEWLHTPHVRPAIDATRPKLLRIVGEKTIGDALGHL